MSPRIRQAGGAVPAAWLAGVVRPAVSGVGHDAVVGAAGAGAAGAGTVAAGHLRGGPPVEFHQVSLRAASVQPGVAEMVPEPVRVDVHAALLAASGGHLVDAGRGERLPVARAQPQLRPPRLPVPGAGTEVPVQAPGSLVTDPDDPVLAALAADRNLPLPQINVAAPWVTRVIPHAS